MEQQAKERLTGGVILVILLVLLVPELLTGPRIAPPAAPAQPDQAPMRSYTMDLNESTRSNSAPVAASTTAPSTGASAPQIKSEPATAAAESRPPETASTPPAPTTYAEEAPPAPVPAPKAKPPARAPAVAHVAAPTTLAPSAARPVEHAAAAWTVQVGTFASRDNAAHLVASLKSHGFNSSISEATRHGHKMFRVRVGAERDRAAAQKLLGRLKAAGQRSGEVVPR